MIYEVKYDDGITQWSAFFEDQGEALDQAASDVHVYGGVPAQEIVDESGTQVVDQAGIEQAAGAI
jgi:hypothetical protein